MSGHVHQTYLMVRDLDRSLSFYQNVLELPVRDQTGSRAKFKTGNCTLVLEEDFDEALLSEFGLSPPGNDRGSGVIIVIEVPDVEHIHENAATAGETILMDVKKVEWGREMFLLEDPDGYVFEISRPVD